MMKKIIIFMLTINLYSVCLFARSIPGANNEVPDPWFLTPNTGWYINGSYLLHPNIGLPGNYIDIGRDSGDKCFLRTIVDDAQGNLWNPNFNAKEIDFSFFGHVDGDGLIEVKFDWWKEDDIIMDPPPMDPVAPFPFTPMYSNSLRLSDFGPSDFSIRDDLILPGETIPPGWHIYNYHTVWDFQPRWVSIEISMMILPDELGNHDGLSGGEALLTGVDFQAKCIPEPNVMAFCAFGVIWVFFLRIKRI